MANIADATTTNTTVFGDWCISTHAEPTSTRRAISQTTHL